MSGDQGATLPGNAEAGGLLLTAFRAGKTEEIKWATVTVGGLFVTVASDAMKVPLNGLPGVRLPVSYTEAVSICAALSCIAPTQKICDAMFAQAKARLTYVGLWRQGVTDAQMKSVDFVIRFHERVEAQLAAIAHAPGDLVFGAWKLWILHPRLVVKDAVNYGFWDKSKNPVEVIQSPGARHDPQHYDYSQLLVPIKRMARKAGSGAEVDLLDYVATDEGIPARYLDPYRA